MISYLLDTNVVSEELKSRPHPALMERMRRAEGRCAIASTTWNELLFGMHRLEPSRRKIRLQEWLLGPVRAALPIVSYAEQEAEWHAGERARLARIGRTAPFVDGQIAAVAAVRGLTLVTANVADFASFAGLRVENWLEPPRGGLNA